MLLPAILLLVGGCGKQENTDAEIIGGADGPTSVVLMPGGGEKPGEADSADVTGSIDDQKSDSADVATSTNVQTTGQANVTASTGGRMEAADEPTVVNETLTVSDAIRCYADFLKNYMDKPVVYQPEIDEWGETDTPESAENVAFTLIYLDDDTLPELAVANGSAPWNPVHLFGLSGQDVKELGAYSMYGQSYYRPKSGYVLPVYYLPAYDDELVKAGSGETTVFHAEEDSMTMLPVFGPEKTFLADTENLVETLTRMSEDAPVGITALGAPIVDDAYLTQDALMIVGMHSEEIPGIWYLQENTLPGALWIEFDTVGTFTAHEDREYVEATGYIIYREPSPLLPDGGIYDMFMSDGTLYRSFEIAPDGEGCFEMNFSGAIYRKEEL